MSDKPRWEGKVIDIRDARLAFFKGHEAEARTNRQGVPVPGAKKKFSCTLLLDPSNEAHAKNIIELKQEAFRALTFRFGPKEQWPVNPGGVPLFLPFGLGNDLPKQGKKIYDGFENMWYINLRDESRPSLRNRAGKPVVEGDPECPYGGCYVNGKTTFYAYDNESKGAGANFRSLQFVRDGRGFGGGSRGIEDEYAALAGDSPGKGVVAMDDEGLPF